VIYLDSHATTPLDASVAEVLSQWQRAGTVANPGSPSDAGRSAANAVQSARAAVAALVAGSPSRTLFTSGATESNNLCLAVAWATDLSHVISSPIEHPSVLQPLLAARDAGKVNLDLAEVGADGGIDPAQVAALVRPSTALISIQAANNETGILNPIDEIGEVARVNGILFHCDGAQAIGKVPIDVTRQGIDFLTLSGHKIYGPMGVGAIVASPKGISALTPIAHGGGQERGLRSGTVNVPGVVGLGVAAEIAASRLDKDATHLSRLRDRLQRRLAAIPGATFNGSGERLPGSINIRFDDVPADALIASCPQLAFSSGSACSTGSPAPSHVLLAMGLSDAEADEAVRFGLPRDLTENEIDSASEVLSNAIDRIRGLVHA
jgi:cysteine desulfurase